MNHAVLRIEKMAFGGAGFGHIEGKACFVPYTAPGDLVRIRICKEKRSFMEGELLELLEPAEQRMEPPCPVFGECGGCHWQHLSYSQQLQAKENIFAEILWRSGRVPRERIMPIVPAPDAFAYRSRAQLKIRFVDDEPLIGFYRAGSHFVVNIPEKCAIVHPVINRLVAGLRHVLKLCPDAARIPQIDAATGDDGRAELVVHYIGDRKVEIIDHFRQHGPALDAASVFMQSGRKSTLETVFCSDGANLNYRVPAPAAERADISISFGSGGFSQVNFRQNLALIHIVREWAALSGKEKVLDLFCGNGNFSLPLATEALHVTGVEEYPPSIDVAIANAVANSSDNVSFVCADAAAALAAMISAAEKFDVVVLDPPREGAAQIAGAIPAVNPRAIIYVSCDPATLARDIGIMKKAGYDVVRSRPVDMFPQTYHIESVTLLATADTVNDLEIHRGPHGA